MNGAGVPAWRLVGRAGAAREPMSDAGVRTLLLVCCAGVALLSLAAGAVAITPADIARIVAGSAGIGEAGSGDAALRAVLLHIRMPRVVLAATVGATLGICGAGLQGMFRNPLADPALIGVSAGAAVAVVIVTVAGNWIDPGGRLGLTLPSIAGFVGALATVSLVHRISLRSDRTVITTMLLAGIGVNALAGAITALLVHFATDAQVRSILFWTMGSLSGASWKLVAVAIPVLAVSALMLMPLHRALDAMMLGESEAGYLGIDVEATKRRILRGASLGVAMAVAATGVIGFVALVAPRLMRLLCGPGHRQTMAGSLCIGAILLMASDLGARTLAAPAELPVGALTALAGAPLLLWLLRPQREAELEP
ncbi:MAG TPA: iron ABC transporter permease [Candidatus Binatia bacterium]|nr:iron ABC transporter permease [Candidatus Binatia bacterium]